MFKLLPLTVPLIQGETVTSYASRLAARNGAPSVRDFCSDVRLAWDGIEHGHPESVANLAALGGADYKALQRYAIRMRKPGTYEIGLLKVSVRGMNRTKLKVCPHCIHEDKKNYGALGPTQRIYWLFERIRTCHIHNTPLVHIPIGPYPAQSYDFSRYVRRHSGAIPTFKATPVRPASPLERYLVKRLDRTNAPTWLDQLDIDTAARAAERIGCGLHGRGQKVARITESEWPQFGGTGFEALKGGLATLEPALCTYLDAKGPRADVPCTGLSDFYVWLFTTMHVADYEPIRDLMRQFVVKHFTIADTAKIFGESVGKTRHRSMIKIARELAVSQEAPEERNDTTESRRTLSELISVGEAGKMLGCDARRLRSLTGMGHIRVAQPGGRRGCRLLRDDVVRFMARLESKIAVRVEAPGCFVPLGNAVFTTHIDYSELIRAILQRQVAAVRISGAPQTLAEIRVDLAAIWRLINVAENPTCQDIATRLRINKATVRYLCKHGFLPASNWRSHDPRAQSRNVTEVTLQEFEAIYVSAGSLGKTHEKQPRWITTQAANAGATPITGSPLLSYIYRREDIRTVF